MSTELRVKAAVVQARAGDAEAAIAWLEACSEKKAGIVVFPEAFLGHTLRAISYGFYGLETSKITSIFVFYDFF